MMITDRALGSAAVSGDRSQPKIWDPRFPDVIGAPHRNLEDHPEATKQMVTDLQGRNTSAGTGSGAWSPAEGPRSELLKRSAK